MGAVYFVHLRIDFKSVEDVKSSLSLFIEDVRKKSNGWKYVRDYDSSSLNDMLLAVFNGRENTLDYNFILKDYSIVLFSAFNESYSHHQVMYDCAVALCQSCSYVKLIVDDDDGCSVYSYTELKKEYEKNSI